MCPKQLLKVIVGITWASIRILINALVLQMQWINCFPDDERKIRKSKLPKLENLYVVIHVSHIVMPKAIIVLNKTICYNHGNSWVCSFGDVT
jgi:hypothetical protein